MRIAWIPILLFLGACGYQFGQGSIVCKYTSISIPYISGDQTGEMTEALIREMSRSGALLYKNHSADLCLKVKILNFLEDNIGYMYGPDDNHGYEKKNNTNSIIPNETRITVIAQVEVIDSASGCVILGPGRLTASYDFDHDYYFSPDGINQTSLGQLTNMESAREAVIKPLSVVLAQKITDFVINSW